MRGMPVSGASDLTVWTPEQVRGLGPQVAGGQWLDQGGERNALLVLETSWICDKP